MDAETLTALKGSIEKWEKIVAGTGEDLGPANCPLCQKFIKDKGDGNESCSGCPVRNATGQAFCEGSPYEDFCDHRDEDWDYVQPLAEAEVDFLKSLLPTDEAAPEVRP